MTTPAAGSESLADRLAALMRQWDVNGAELARALKVPQMRITRLLSGGLVSVDSAERLGRFFETGAEFWLQVQLRHNLASFDENLRRQIARLPTVRRYAEQLGRRDSKGRPRGFE